MTATSIKNELYDIAVEERSDYLYVTLNGDANSYEIARQYWQEIIAKTGGSGRTRVLIEQNIAQRLDTQDVFRVLTEVAFIERSGGKFAFFDRFLDREKSEFEELVAGNRGLNVKHFDNIADAERWLSL